MSMLGRRSFDRLGTIITRSKDDAEQLLRQQEIKRKRFGLDRKREAMEAQITALRSDFESEESEILKVIGLKKQGMNDS